MEQRNGPAEASPRLLLIEDDSRIASFVSRGLEKHGIEVTSVEDGAVGAFLGATERFDAVILDLMLPSAGGLDVLSHLRSTRPDVPIVVLTAADLPQERRRAVDAGAAAYITKPFRFEELSETVQALVRQGTENPQ